ncbi:glutamine amidotransferase [Marinobacterium nitratireducens]|uniref:Glutamine amidotransferase n=1 Tax=Marinobacterium nitratireducens TaxID=518897 RepID=A0A917ZQ05_9GAMM|nr:glutamine amidotransferase [Marinobacterium nitratireducens]GGO88045.1 glutamine amidotransferase [Marinobacterium nitratireducens]
MKIGILETGTSPEEMKAAYGSYSDLFVRHLGAVDETLDFEVFRVVDDVFPQSPGDCDSWVITGSRHGVYEDLPWMRRLKDFIVELWQARRPLVGICFGHQIVAEALGGRVEKSSRGWGVGLHAYQLVGEGNGLGNRGGRLTLNALHQDQVVEKPAGARVFASSDFCPYAGLQYGDSILTLQAHPEFSIDYTAALLELRRGSPITPQRVDEALAGLQSPGAASDSGRVAPRLVAFLRGLDESAASAAGF